jgi:ABC-type multidrug transport system ATPase subunit
VDPKTEHEIVTALRQAMTGRTTFIVANRLSLLRRADVILVLEKGRLLHVGTHDELAHVPGTYRETALLQLMDLTERTGEAATLKSGHSAKLMDDLAVQPGRAGYPPAEAGGFKERL